jgi:outer membrane lipoprotein-sorting protein
MALTSKIRIRNATVALFVGVIAGAGTIASFGEHTAHPSISVTFRDVGDSEQGFALLKRMLEADAQVSLEGDQMTTLFHDGRPIVSEQHVLRDGSRGLKIVYTAPPRMVNTVVVDDGQSMWKYDPEHNRLEQSPSKLKKRLARFPSILHAHKNGTLSVAVIGNERVAGRPCTIIQIQRKKDPGPLRTFWVDDATGIQLKAEMHERSGALRSVTQYTSVSFNVPIPFGAFERPQTRPGVRVEERNGEASANTIERAASEAGFGLLQPGYLPSGYRFQSAQVTRFEGRKMVHARYLNGINTLSVFQTPQSGPGSDVSYPKQGVATMVIAGHRVVVVANISDEELARVIRSMR